MTCNYNYHNPPAIPRFPKFVMKLPCPRFGCAHSRFVTVYRGMWRWRRVKDLAADTALGYERAKCLECERSRKHLMATIKTAKTTNNAALVNELEEKLKHETCWFTTANPICNRLLVQQYPFLTGQVMVAVPYVFPCMNVYVPVVYVCV